MKRGVTHRHIARLFKRGYSVLGLSKKYKCEEHEIQHAIRMVMNRRSP